jgi:2-C-methyl-D-erythritol 4-phosphate cytidylyltransferase / 2-C-methyl-D-erythritol 2,4-cyclodiphosphate synthase
MQIDVVIVAAGRGVRAGEGIPKQYRQLAGRPVLAHTIGAFAGHAAVRRVQVVIHPDDAALYSGAVAGAARLLPPVAGGDTRQESVRHGLAALAATPPDRVLIHDGARPLVPRPVIDRVLAALDAFAGAIAALPVQDTLKRDNGGIAAGGVDRAGLWRAQTPQGFDFAAIRAAHEAQHGGNLTDDAAVAEAAGLAVALVEGDEDNLKLTNAGDFARAERLLERRLGDTRVGTGFDVHAFSDEPGRQLILCGVPLSHARGLAGHSDADAGLHALTDAILGALAEGDIGEHFPPSDPRWRGAASEQFLRYAAERVAARGGLIANADVTLICEAPKIAPHRAAMRARIAAILGVAAERVSVKATTTEKLGFTGRGEGIAAQATATIRLPG